MSYSGGENVEEYGLCSVQLTNAVAFLEKSGWEN
jgi:hypothetical protein